MAFGKEEAWAGLADWLLWRKCRLPRHALAAFAVTGLLVVLTPTTTKPLGLLAVATASPAEQNETTLAIAADPSPDRRQSP